MGVIEILVQAAELAAAANEINQAVETYKDAVEAAKSAAADLASKWEGESQVAFVRQQENAYGWHAKIITIVLDMISVIRKAIDLYNETEERVKNLIKQ